MFPTHKRILHLHVNGQVIRTTADHPLNVEGKGWNNAGDMPGAKVEGEQENPGEPAMPHFPVVGFAAGTPIMTSTGYKRIEDLKPGDMIQVQPDDDQGYGKAEDQEPGWWENN